MPVEGITHEMAECDINEDLWETTNQQPVTQQIKETKWQWIVHMPRKLNVAVENLARLESPRSKETWVPKKQQEDCKRGSQ